MTFKEFIKAIDPNFEFTKKVEFVVDSIDRWHKSGIQNLLLNLPRKFGKTTLARYYCLFLAIIDESLSKQACENKIALVSSNVPISNSQNNLIIKTIKLNQFDVKIQKNDNKWDCNKEFIFLNNNKIIITKPSFGAFCGNHISFLILDELLYSFEDYSLERNYYQEFYEVLQMRLSSTSRQVFFNNLELGKEVAVMFKELNEDYFEITIS